MSRLTNSTNDILNGKAKQIDMIKEQQIYLKLKTLEDIEEKLGCPLEVVFKALKEGFYTQTMYHSRQDNTWLGINDLGYTKEIFCMYFDENMTNTKTCVERDLKDYRKTWWLTGDRSE